MMKSIKSTYLPFLLTLLLSLCGFSQATARTALISNASQLKSNSSVSDEPLSNLLDGNGTTTFHSHNNNSRTEQTYIQVALPTGFSMTDEEVLVVYIKRCPIHKNNHPTAFRVTGSTDNGATFSDKTLFSVFFTYRGPATDEYSSRIQIPEEFRSNKYTHLRFYVTANNSRMEDSEGNASMGLAEFQVYKLGKYEPYSSTMFDRFHHYNDYNYTFSDYTFINTQGVIDNCNHQADDEIKNWSDWTQWQTNKGKWTKDTDFLNNHGIKMPDFSFLDGSSDPRMKDSQLRQAAHTTEHIVYAVPGDIVPLFPYYRMGDYYTIRDWAYHENFSHWYNYNTGGRLIYEDGIESIDMLDFLIDPSEIHRTDDYGFYGSFGLATKPADNKTLRIYTPDDWVRFTMRVNNGETTLNADIVAEELDFSGYGILPPVGDTGLTPYKGTINGGGATIKNLHIRSTGLDGGGLVGQADDGCTILNLTVDSSCVFEARRSDVGLVGKTTFKKDAPGTGLTIKNVDTNATVYAYGESITADGILGAAMIGSNPSDGPVLIENCHIGGIVDVKQISGNTKCFGAAICAYLGGGENDRIKVVNTYITSNVIHYPNDNHYNYRLGTNLKNSMINVYSVHQGWQTHIKAVSATDVNKADFISKLNNGTNAFVAGIAHAIPVMAKITLTEDKPVTYDPTSNEAKTLRKYGTLATFFCPRDPYNVRKSLPLPPGSKEFVIAADFSQNFNVNYHLNTKEREIKEPIVAFRHIFRVRDGVAFAEEFSGSPENNRTYNRHNIRRIAAPIGHAFQVRLDSPLPGEIGAPTNYYYKAAEDDYRRVDQIISTPTVLDPITRKPVTDAPVFSFGADFLTEDHRNVDGMDYYALGGGTYNRMLKCDSPKEGKYLVQIVGGYLDHSDNTVKPITTFGGSVGNPDDRLVVMEFEIEFLPTGENGAHFILEDDLYSSDNKYEYARPETLVKEHFEPKSSVTFDEFASLETLPNASDYVIGSGKKFSYKWPLQWKSSSNIFAYQHANTSGTDYNSYILASHSDKVRWSGGARWENYNKNDGEGYGLFDRLFYDSRREGYQGDKTRGYFYYVNAADDPGVMARLEINDLCLGSTIYVSAWVAECSGGDETANLALNFIAVTEKGERLKVHSFVTGYVPSANRGKWMNAYYSFVPELASLDVDDDDRIISYELELDNNCMNSNGADYAIDDICVYIGRPELFASQMSNVCDANVTSAKVKIWSPFKSLLSVLGVAEAVGDEKSVPVEVYYTFINKDKFDEVYKANGGDNNANAGKIAFETPGCVLQYDYDGTGDSSRTYGTLTFSSRFSENDPYDPDKGILAKGCAEVINGREMIVFNSVPSDDDLIADKNYYIVMYLQHQGETFTPDWNTFNFKQSCAKYDTFNVKKAFDIKVNGEIINLFDNMACCENQSPVIQVNLLGIDKTTGKVVIADKNAYFDWWDGPLDEYNAMKKGDMELWMVLDIFRSAYPTADRLDDVKPNLNLGFTQDMIDWIKGLSTDIPSGASYPKLTLHRSSFVFPPLKIKPGEESSTYYVLALPIAKDVEQDKELGNVRICATPTQVGILVIHKSPLLSHGLNKGISYPATLHDIPLRVGLQQLKDVSVAQGSNLTGAPTLSIPVRNVETKGDPNVQSMRLIADDNLIYLASTNDPAYKDLGTLDENGEEREDLLICGEIVNLKADKAGTDNRFDIVFYNSFTFREGYEYRMRFGFEENDPNASATDEVVCNGEDIFTIKVVPAYAKWVGTDNRNWNNDANWHRMSATELHYTAGDSDVAAWRENVTDQLADRKNIYAYAPLDFTNVVIPSGSAAPVLYDADKQNLKGSFPEIGGDVWWTDTPDNNSDYISTLNIQYDMAAYQKGGKNLNCRPWYPHTCGNIHLEASAMLYRQQHLHYNAASVDMEMDGARWYTLASPMRETFAGDFYLPTADARQTSGFFRDITFDKDLNDRFHPAVYQRGWNRSSATVYLLDEGKSKDVAVHTDWSRVFNDVAEQYGGGVGFSIKSDVSGISASSDKVLFRLPKADTDYDYYTHAGVTDWKSEHVNRSNLSSKLNPGKGEITVKARTGSEYFLVGNPFVMPMDMKAFLENEVNVKVLEPAYWIVTEDGQGAAIFDENTAGYCGTATGTIAPFQGFFVKLKTDAAAQSSVTDDGDTRTLTLQYTPEMQQMSATPLPELQLPTRATDTEIRISLIDLNGATVSESLLKINENAERGFVKGEDLQAMLHPGFDLPAVFTVAGNMAASINTLPDAEGVEIGVFNPTDNPTILHIPAQNDTSLKLADRLTDEIHDLDKDVEINVEGNVHGRFYLTRGAEELPEIESEISCKAIGNNVTVSYNGSQPMTVTIYDISGRIIDRTDNILHEYSVILNTGIYIVEATAEECNLKQKIAIR